MHLFLMNLLSVTEPMDLAKVLHQLGRTQRPAGSVVSDNKDPKVLMGQLFPVPPSRDHVISCSITPLSSNREGSLLCVIHTS